MAALTDGRAWLDGVVAQTRENRGRLAGELRTRGFGVLEGAANFVLAATGPGADDASTSPALALKAALAERGIGVRAFEGLEGVGDAIRVTVGPWAIMERFLAALDETLAAGVRLAAPDLEAGT